MTRYAIPKKEPLLAQHEAWRDTVLGKPANVTPAEHGVNAILVAEAALDAALPVPPSLSLSLCLPGWVSSRARRARASRTVTARFRSSGRWHPPGPETRPPTWPPPCPAR